MNKTVLREAEAIYEAGVLRPLKPIDLAENTRVHISISEAVANPFETQTERDRQVFDLFHF